MSQQRTEGSGDIIWYEEASDLVKPAAVSQAKGEEFPAVSGCVLNFYLS